MKAITTKEISGACIKTIPVGTPFEIFHIGDRFSSCKGLGITSIWNDEYALVEENDEEITTEDDA